MICSLHLFGDILLAIVVMVFLSSLLMRVKQEESIIIAQNQFKGPICLVLVWRLYFGTSRFLWPLLFLLHQAFTRIWKEGI